ncbi:MAG TPA: hypothetical protein VNA68_03110 [Candidatus Dormibacteraeota bacterium]|nr:hypothetical protein [Candidatus Dormibacteraeota bacterium]
MGKLKVFVVIAVVVLGGWQIKKYIDSRTDVTVQVKVKLAQKQVTAYYQMQSTGKQPGAIKKSISFYRCLKDGGFQKRGETYSHTRNLPQAGESRNAYYKSWYRIRAPRLSQVRIRAVHTVAVYDKDGKRIGKPHQARSECRTVNR